MDALGIDMERRINVELPWFGPLGGGKTLLQPLGLARSPKSGVTLGTSSWPGDEEVCDCGRGDLALGFYVCNVVHPSKVDDRLICLVKLGLHGFSVGTIYLEGGSYILVSQPTFRHLVLFRLSS